MSAPQIINVSSPVARRLRGSLRAVDTPSRLGGDEVAFLLENVAEPTAAFEVAERIRAAMAEPFPVASPAVDVRLSIGLAVAQTSDTPDMIVRGARGSRHRSVAGLVDRSCGTSTSSARVRAATGGGSPG